MAAIPGVVTAGIDVNYVVLGEGDDRSRLEQLARNFGVSERVNFKGAVRREVLLDAYRMADMYVMPSTGEGFGIAYLEAMASGTPAMGLAVAGASDALADGSLGETTSEAKFAEALVRALTRPKPDAAIAAEATRARFGSQAFAAAARDAVIRLRESV
jgi:phosphatidylinositol alpha-1,6-mannosyltransferase